MPEKALYSGLLMIFVNFRKQLELKITDLFMFLVFTEKEDDGKH